MKYIVLVLGLLLGSCSNQKGAVVKSFPEIQTLNGEQISIGDNVYDDIFVCDSLLFAFSAYKRDVFIDVYNANSKIFIRSLTLKGNGKNEFLSLSINKNSFLKDNGAIKILAYDPQKSLLSLINVTNSLKEAEIVIEKAYELPRDIIEVNPLNDNNILMFRMPMESKFEYQLYNFETKESTEINILQDKITEQNYRGLRHAIAFWPDKNKYVVAMSFLNNVIISSLNNENDENDESTKFSVYDSPKHIKDIMPILDRAQITYNDILIYKDKIICLYINEGLMDMFQSSTPVELHVFNSDGTPFKKYDIKEHLVFLSIDSVNNKLYGKTPKYEFYEYDFKM